MKKGKSSSETEIRAEYNRADFGSMVRGRFHKQVAESSNIVILDSSVAKEFPNSVAVNRALKAIISKRKSVKTAKTVSFRAKKASKSAHVSKRT